MSWVRIHLAITVVALIALTGPDWAAGQNAITEGRLHAVWEDPIPGQGTPRLRFFLSDDTGSWSELRGHENDQRLAGRLLSLDRSYVRVSGERRIGGVDAVTATVFDVASVTPAAEPGPAPLGVVSADAAVSGSQPWVTVMCRFAGSGSTPHSRSWYEGMLGSADPGLDAYWRESSFGALDIAGSRAVGWYDLPQPKSAYMNGDTPNLGKLRDDCAGAADADVFYPDFVGVNFQFNENIGCCSWGGSMQLALDGVSQFYRATWMAPWADFNVYGHEMGHGFGLPHSSGPYGRVYDSDWDVMSRGQGVRDGTYGWIPPHTIAYHKNRLGWLSAETRHVVYAGQSTTVEISALRDMAPPGAYHVVEIPVSDEIFYTVEARIAGGYDNPPGDAVVMHLVGGHSPPAQVVDPDNDGNANDDGAMWLPGETFRDAANDITVRVDSRTANGYQVSIDRGGIADPTPLIALTPTSLAYETSEGSSPPDQNLEVQNSGSGILDWNASVNRGWLTLGRTSGSLSGGASRTVSVSVDAGALSAGTHTGTISVTGNADNSPQEVAVQVTVTAVDAPLIAVSPVSLTYDTQEGQNPGEQSFTVQNSGTGTLDWTASANRSWIGLGASSGSLNAGVAATVSVDVDVSGMSAGSYTGTVTIGGNAGNSPQELTVALTITAAEVPLIALSPGSLSFAANVGEDPTPLDFSVQNSGQGTLDWSTATDRSWLSVSPLSGSLGAGATAGVTVTVDASGLAAGTYSGTVTVSGNADNSPQALAVEFQLFNASEPLIAISPASLAMQTKGGKKNSPKANLGIGNAGDQTLSWSATTNQGWLKLATGSGSLESGGSDSVGVSLSLEGLEAGTYQALVTVSGNAPNSPQTIPVELKLTKGAVVKIRRGKLTYAGSTEEQPLAKSFTMENEGDETSYWSVSTDHEWILLAAESGVLTVGDTQRVGVSIDITDLDPGNHRGTITLVGDEDLDPVTLDVSLIVSNGPGVKHSVDEVAAELLESASQLGPNEIHYLDQVGNGNGQFDVGDLRAWLMQRGDLSGAPPLAVIGSGYSSVEEAGQRQAESETRAAASSIQGRAQ